MEKYNFKGYRDFYIPLEDGNITLKEGLKLLETVASEDSSVPLVIQLVENPKYDIPFFDIFHGAVDLYHHDCIHLLLGRGLLSKDEAFVIGFTMGSTNKVNIFEKMLFKFITKYIYKKPWNFNSDDVIILDIAMNLGHKSKCHPLDKVDFKSMEDMTIGEIRKSIGIELEPIRQAYLLEKILFNGKDSQRLLSD